MKENRFFKAIVCFSLYYCADMFNRYKRFMFRIVVRSNKGTRKNDLPLKQHWCSRLEMFILFRDIKTLVTKVLQNTWTVNSNKRIPGFIIVF